MGETRVEVTLLWKCRDEYKSVSHGGNEQDLVITHRVSEHPSILPQVHVHSLVAIFYFTAEMLFVLRIDS